MTPLATANKRRTSTAPRSFKPDGFLFVSTVSHYRCDSPKSRCLSIFDDVQSRPTTHRCTPRAGSGDASPVQVDVSVLVAERLRSSLSRARMPAPGVTLVILALHYFRCSFMFLKYFPDKLSIGK